MAKIKYLKVLAIGSTSLGTGGSPDIALDQYR